MKLYELAAEYQNFIDAIEAGEIPPEAITDTLDSIDAEIEDKADNICCAIKNLIAEAEAIKVEEDNLAERRKAKEKEAENLKSYLSNMLQAIGKDKIETSRNKITFRKSEKVEFVNEAQFIEWAMSNDDSLLKFANPTVNKTAIKAAIKNGLVVEGAYLSTNQNIQIK